MRLCTLVMAAVGGRFEGQRNVHTPFKLVAVKSVSLDNQWRKFMRLATLFAAAAFGLLTIAGAQAAGVGQGAAVVTSVSGGGADAVQVGWRRHRHHGWRGHRKPPYCARNPNRCYR